jgi:hypothetical protein
MKNLLPKKLSDCIDVALKDLDDAKKLGFKVDMGRWYSRGEMIKGIILALTLTGCGSTGLSGDPRSARFLMLNNKAPAGYINPRISPLIDQYMQDAANAGLSSPKFPVWKLKIFDFADGLLQGDIPHGQTVETQTTARLGICMFLEGVNPINHKRAYDLQAIYFDSSLREVDTGFAFRAVVWHELSHCLFGMSHNDEDSSSIMFPFLSQEEEYWQTHWDLERDNLFDWIKAQQ